MKIYQQVTQKVLVVKLHKIRLRIKGSFDGAGLSLAGDVFSAPEGYSAPMKLTGKLENGKLAGDIVWDAYQVTFQATKAE